MTYYRVGVWEQMLKQDMGFEKVIVASFFNMDEELMELGDAHLKEEDSLSMLVDADNYNIIVGDPLYKDLLRNNTKHIYIYRFTSYCCFE